MPPSTKKPSSVKKTMNVTVEFVTRSGKKVHYIAKKRTPARTPSTLESRLRKVPPALRARARMLWRRKRGII